MSIRRAAKSRARTSATVAVALALTGGLLIGELPNISPASAAAPTIAVATASQLTSALASARAGTTIVLAPGTYRGTFTTRAKGKPTAPITVTGPRTAVLTTGSTSTGTAMTVAHDHWTLSGFGVASAHRGIVLVNADDTAITGVEVAMIGREGISLTRGSSDVSIRDSVVRDTGVALAARGDGIAVGTPKAEWAQVTGSAGTADRSDGVIIERNTISRTAGEGVDVREGTEDAQIRGNVFTRAGHGGGAVADSWVEIKGDDSIVEGNSGSGAVADAFQVRSVMDKWGGGNAFRNNTVTGVPGYEVRIDSKEKGNTVACHRTGAALGVSNATCVGGAPVSAPAPAPSPDRVPVATAAQLTAALAAARPGQTIVLASGTYTGRFVAAAEGTAAKPITLTGPRSAVLTTGSPSSGYGLHLTGDHWVVTGLSVSGAQKGIMLDGSNRTVIDGVDVGRIGHEAVHVRRNSVGVVIRNSTVHDTGLTNVDYGEGIYVGTAKSNWASIMGSSSTLDRSDRVLIENNRITDTTAEGIDIKEGTTGGIVRGNVFLRVGNSGGAFADSWVDVKGNGYLLEGNSGSITGLDAFQTHSVVTGWGGGNTFRNNTVISGVPGFEVRIDKKAPGNTVACAPTKAVLGLSNIPCT